MDFGGTQLMGLGGSLIWTGVFEAIQEQHQVVAVSCDTPMLSDLIRGYLWRRDRDYRDDMIFKGNPNIGHVLQEKKTSLEMWLDSAFEKLISPDRLRRSYEKLIFSISLSRWKGGFEPLYVHIDMRIHSYASRQDKRRTFWKNGGCAAHVIAKPFGVEVLDPICRFFPTAKENMTVQELLEKNGIHGAYVVVEPDTNRDWFGDLRAWPFDEWQDLVWRLRKLYPQLHIVQTGLGRGGVLDGVTDFTNSLDFRSVASLLRHAKLFLGTEGGLMHLAAATKTQSVILWGGVTLPEFAGYPHLHSIICHYVECAPCGNAGWCDNKHICMKSISVEEVLAQTKKALEF